MVEVKLVLTAARPQPAFFFIFGSVTPAPADRLTLRQANFAGTHKAGPAAGLAADRYHQL
jgi:hypothetical protein